ncbi:MAG TPA: hypothetical protein VKV33_01005, partial [Streptosporangiaceae bacterium]|nr:hypothetical protein [Streptosporangiaceae bacterium]
NTQPWWFRITADDRIELRANVDGSAGAHRGRWDLMLNADAPGPWPREFAISSGAALFNLRMAFRVVGHDPVVTLLPDPADDPGLLASVEIVVGRTRPPTFIEQGLYSAIWNRHTDRWPYTRHPVRPAILVAMERAAAREHGLLHLLHGTHLRSWMRAAEHADQILREEVVVASDDPFRVRLGQYRAELAEWTGQNADGCGVPETAFGPHPAKLPAPVRDFTLGDPGDAPHERFERHPQLLVLCTERDEPIDWLRAGQALQRALLAGAGFGVVASFLTQPLELADLRFMSGHENGLPAGSEAPRGIGIPWRGHGVDAFQQASASAVDRRSYARRRLLGLTPWLEVPQVVLRVGYPAENPHKPNPRTRRAEPEVIDARSGPPHTSGGRRRSTRPGSRPGWPPAPAEAGRTEGRNVTANPGIMARCSSRRSGSGPWGTPTAPRWHGS